MQYELECGHCGYQFVRGATELPRTMKCDVCGSVLTIAIPVPLAPPPPPAPVPALPVKPNPVPLPRAPRAPDSPFDEPHGRRRLAEPWPSIHIWLDTARAASEFARVLYILCLFFNIFVCPLTPVRRGEMVLWFLSTMGVALLIPTVIHIGCQIVMVHTPRAYGGNWARASLVLLGLAALLGLVTYEGSPGGAIALAVLLVIVSACVWVEFLVRLGLRLGDIDLLSAARAFRLPFWFGTVMMLTFLIGAVLADDARSAPQSWVGRIGAGAIGFFLLSRYVSLLRTAARAVVRHAPAVSDS